MTHQPQHLARWRDEWPERYRAGASTHQIADDPQGGYVGTVSRSYVWKVLREAGAVLRPKGGPPNPAAASWVSMYEGGASIRQIAAAAGYSISAVHQELRGRCVRMRPVGQHRGVGAQS